MIIAQESRKKSRNVFLSSDFFDAGGKLGLSYIKTIGKYNKKDTKIDAIVLKESDRYSR